MKIIKKYINKILRRKVSEYYIFSIKHEYNSKFDEEATFDNKKELLEYVKYCIDERFNNNKCYWDILDEELIYNYLESKDVFKAVRLFNYNVGRFRGITFSLDHQDVESE